MAPHSSTLAWKIPWTEEPGRLQSMGSWRVGHDWATSLWLFTFMHWRRKWQPTPVFLPKESQGWGSLVGCCLWGRRVGHDWSDLAAAAARTYVVRSQPFLIPCDPMDCIIHGVAKSWTWLNNFHFHKIFFHLCPFQFLSPTSYSFSVQFGSVTQS